MSAEWPAPDRLWKIGNLVNDELFRFLGQTFGLGLPEYKLVYMLNRWTFRCGKGSVRIPKHEVFSRATGISRRNITTYLNFLKEAHIIRVSDSTEGTKDVYEIMTDSKTWAIPAKTTPYDIADADRMLGLPEQTMMSEQVHHNEGSQVTCVYCGHAYVGPETWGAEELKNHIRICEKHPMRELEAENARLRRLVEELVEDLTKWRASK